MTNYEKYKTEITRITNRGLKFAVVDGRVTTCEEVLCQKCEFSCGDCTENRKNWMWEDALEDLDIKAVIIELEKINDCYGKILKMLKASVKND